MENISTIYEGVVAGIEAKRKANYKKELEYRLDLALLNDETYQEMNTELGKTEERYKPYIQAAIDLRIAHLKNPIIDSLPGWYIGWDSKQIIKAKIALLVEQKKIDQYTFETLVDTLMPISNEKAD